MAEDSKRVLILSRDHHRCVLWVRLLESAGWQVRRVSSLDGALTGIAEFSPALMFANVEAGEHVIDIEEDFARRCRESGVAVIPILSEPTPADVADSFRRGAIDVLVEPFTDQEMLSAIDRARSFKDLYRENKNYRLQIERANRELRDSLNTLKMDQMAGRQIQLNILPDKPLVYGEYEIAHKIVPSLYLSGDFVGYSVLLDRFLIFYVADVSGHGASSAFVTIMLSFMVRQLSWRHINEDDIAALLRAPQGLLEHINRQVLAMKIDKHLTMLVGSIDTERNVLRYVTGAQLPMPVMVSNAGVEFLPGKGRPVGLFDDSHWTIEEIILPEKFSLTIISDGLLDCQPGDSIATKEQFLLDACGGADMTHDGICAGLGVADIADARDDVSLLTVIRNPCRG